MLSSIPDRCSRHQTVGSIKGNGRITRNQFVDTVSEHLVSPPVGEAGVGVLPEEGDQVGAGGQERGFKPSRRG